MRDNKQMDMMRRIYENLPEYQRMPLPGDDNKTRPGMPDTTFNEPMVANTPEPENLTGAATNMITSGISSPFYDKIRENQKKRIALQTMPVTDQNGRLQSGLRALIDRLDKSFNSGIPIKHMGQVYAGLAGAGTAFGAGAAMPDHDEYTDRDIELLKLDQDDARLRVLGQEDARYQAAVARAEQGNVRNEIAQQREDRQGDQFAWRRTRATLKDLADEKKSLLQRIMKRGYYYEGDNEAEDAELDKAGIILPDFDTTRKQIKEGGVQKVWDPQQRKYVTASGSEAGVEDRPITFSVDGQEITARTKDFLQYAGAKERQQASIDATNERAEKDRAQRHKQFMINFRERVRRDKQKKDFDKMKLIKEIRSDVAKGAISKSLGDEMIKEVESQ